MGDKMLEDKIGLYWHLSIFLTSSSCVQCSEQRLHINKYGENFIILT